jgi:DNA polymerase III alpha subunit
MINRGDIDIDFANRDSALATLSHTSASIIQANEIKKHNSSVYFHTVPIDPVTGLCSLDYRDAEDAGCFKVDFLNVGVYNDVRDEEHLLELMNRPLDWSMFESEEFVSMLFQLRSHAKLVTTLKPKSKLDIAYILGLIRPGKKHLIPKCQKYGFDSIKDEIWTFSDNDQYVFKKSHSLSYSVLVYVHANLIIEQLQSE